MLLQLFLWPQESACQIVKSVGEEVVLKKIASEGISFAKKSKGSRKQGQVLKCNDKENCSDHEMNINGKMKKAFHQKILLSGLHLVLMLALFQNFVKPQKKRKRKKKGCQFP